MMPVYIVPDPHRPVCVIRENTDSYAKRWDKWHAIDVRSGKIVARGENRWSAQLGAQKKGFTEESALERYRRQHGEWLR